MDAESPEEVVKESDDRIEEIAEVMSRASRMQGKVESLQSILQDSKENISDEEEFLQRSVLAESADDEIFETIESELEHLSSEIDFLLEVADDTKAVEREIQKGLVFISILDSDKLEKVTRKPADINKFTSAVNQLLDMIEEETELMRKSILLSFELPILRDTSDELTESEREKITQMSEDMSENITKIERLASERVDKMEQVKDRYEDVSADRDMFSDIGIF